MEWVWEFRLRAVEWFKIGTWGNTKLWPSNESLILLVKKQLFLPVQSWHNMFSVFFLARIDTNFYIILLGFSHYSIKPKTTRNIKFFFFLFTVGKFSVLPPDQVLCTHYLITRFFLKRSVIWWQPNFSDIRNQLWTNRGIFHYFSSKFDQTNFQCRKFGVTYTKLIDKSWANMFTIWLL